MERLEQLLLLLLFVVLPLGQRAAAWLAERRRRAVARERERRRAEAWSAGPLHAGDEPERRADEEQRGEVLWRRMLEAIGAEEEVPAAPRPAADGGRPPAAGPAPLRPPRETVAPAVPARAADVELAVDLPAFETVPLGSLGPAVDEDAIESGRIERGSLVELGGLDPHESTEPLAHLPGFRPEPAGPLAPAPTPGLARGGRPGARPAPEAGAWRRAIVLSELLAPPLALRGPDSAIPGTSPSP